MPEETTPTEVTPPPRVETTPTVTPGTEAPTSTPTSTPEALPGLTNARIGGALNQFNAWSESIRNLADILNSLLGGRRRSGRGGPSRGPAGRPQGGGTILDRLMGRSPDRPQTAPRLNETMTPEAAKARMQELKVGGAPVVFDAEMRVDMANTADGNDLKNWARRMSMDYRLGDWVTRMERAARMLDGGIAQIADPALRQEWETARANGRVVYRCDGIRVRAELRDEGGRTLKCAFGTGGQVLFMDGGWQLPRGDQRLQVRTARGTQVEWQTTASGSRFFTSERMVYERQNGNVLVEVGRGRPPASVSYTGEGPTGLRSVVTRVNSPGRVIPASTQIDSELRDATAQGTYMLTPQGMVGPPPQLLATFNVQRNPQQAMEAFISRLAQCPMTEVVGYLSSVFPGQSETDIYEMHNNRPGAVALRFNPGNDPLVQTIMRGQISCQQMAVLLSRIAARQGKRAVALEIYKNSSRGASDPNSGHVGCVYLEPPNGGPPCRAIVVDSQGIHDDVPLGEGANALEAATRALENTYDASSGHDPRRPDVGVFDDRIEQGNPQGRVQMGRQSYAQLAQRLIA